MLNLNTGAEETPQTPNTTAQEKIRKKIGTVPKIVFGAALLLVIPMLGNTLAGSITINNVGGKVEFGQGVAQAVVCDSNGVTITPTAGYRSGVFVLETITVTGLDVSSTSTCRGKSIEIYVVDTATALATWITGTTHAGLSFDSSGVASEIPAGSASNFVGTISGTGSSETMTIVASGGWMSSEAVSKFIIQSS